MRITGQLVDIHNKRIYPAQIEVKDGYILSISEAEEAVDQYILPGFIDAHIHIESSMVVPYEFAKIALSHGTIATVSDPHEIANVIGIEGVQYMIDNARDAKLKFHFGAPSCVPATSFETAGAQLSPSDVRTLLESDDIYYLSEMMNYPGVLHGDMEVYKKIKHAHILNKPVDGHAPGLMGDEAKKYIDAGISTDHECITLPEALNKLNHGMKILIREGSAARNYNALHPLIKSHPDHIMFCSDDKHPDDLVNGHINELVRKSLELGYDLFDVLRIACLHPVDHYNLRVGLLREGDMADFIVVEDLKDLKVLESYIDGEQVMLSGKTKLKERDHSIVNQFNISEKKDCDFIYESEKLEIPVIKAIDGEIVTQKFSINPELLDKKNQVNLEKDILKICVINRYHEAPISVGHIANFNLNSGALASSVAHDSHNIVAVGTDNTSIRRAVNLLIVHKGGLSAVCNDQEQVLPLPIAGLMSNLPCTVVAEEYASLDALVKEMGCQLSAPYMTLSFMSLLVIPALKLSDKGLFDVEQFSFV